LTVSNRKVICFPWRPPTAKELKITWRSSRQVKSIYLAAFHQQGKYICLAAFHRQVNSVILVVPVNEAVG